MRRLIGSLVACIWLTFVLGTGGATAAPSPVAPEDTYAFVNSAGGCPNDPVERDQRIARRATEPSDGSCTGECARLACIAECQQALGDAQTKCRAESGSDRAARCLATVERDNEECSDKCEGTSGRPCLGDCRRAYEQAVTRCRSGPRELSPCLDGALTELQSCTADCSSKPSKKR